MLNLCVLQGRLTAAPELKQTPNGVAVTSFNIAIERSIKSADGERQTDFINVVAWRSTAEFICKYFDKGQAILIGGELHSRKYEDKDGNKRTAFEVVTNNVNFCGDKKGSTAPTATTGTAPALNPADIQYVELPDDEDLPF